MTSKGQRSKYMKKHRIYKIIIISQTYKEINSSKLTENIYALLFREWPYITMVLTRLKIDMNIVSILFFSIRK